MSELTGYLVKCKKCGKTLRVFGENLIGCGDNFHFYEDESGNPFVLDDDKN